MTSPSSVRRQRDQPRDCPHFPNNPTQLDPFSVHAGRRRHASKQLPQLDGIELEEPSRSQRLVKSLAAWLLWFLAGRNCILARAVCAILRQTINQSVVVRTTAHP